MKKRKKEENVVPFPSDLPGLRWEVGPHAQGRQPRGDALLSLVASGSSL